MLAKMVYSAYLRTNSKIFGKVLWKIRSVVLRFYNPIITIKHNGFCLKMPFSHTIFAYQKQYPNYDMALGKIARFIKQKCGFLNMVDIGANIGDTAVFANVVGANYLLIEGSEKYANLIEANLRTHYKNIQKFQVGGGQ